MASAGVPGLRNGGERSGGHGRLGAGGVWLGHRVAHMGGHRLASAVETTFLHAAPQFGDRGLAGVEVTVAVCATGLASTRSTPGRRPSTRSTTAFSLAQPRPPTCKTVVAVFPEVTRAWGVMLPTVT